MSGRAPSPVESVLGRARREPRRSDLCWAVRGANPTGCTPTRPHSGLGRGRARDKMAEKKKKKKKKRKGSRGVRGLVQLSPATCRFSSDGTCSPRTGGMALLAGAGFAVLVSRSRELAGLRKRRNPSLQSTGSGLRTVHRRDDRLSPGTRARSRRCPRQEANGCGCPGSRCAALPRLGLSDGRSHSRVG